MGSTGANWDIAVVLADASAYSPSLGLGDWINGHPVATGMVIGVIMTLIIQSFFYRLYAKSDGHDNS